MQAMLMPLIRYADFSGRASRTEYWLFTLMQIFLVVVAMMILGPSEDYSEATAMNADNIFITVFLLVAYMLIFFIPGIAVTVRRFHDQDKSGWFYFLGFVPFVGGLIMLVFMLLPGTDGANQYGSRDY